MNVTIIGAGNIGTLMAADMSRRGHNVTVYTPRADKWNKEIDVFDADDNYLFTSKINYITSDIATAVKNAEIVWITVPAQMFSALSKQLLPYVNPDQIIGVVPGSGGAEFAFAPFIQKGCTLIGLQRVHSIARLKEYGKSVYMLGRKNELQIGSIPQNAACSASELVFELLGIPCVALSNYLCVTLTPSNPILHTSRLYAMFRDYRYGITYDRNILFYEEWTNESSEMLFACDSELQQLCDVIPLNLKDVISLKTHYESNTTTAMTDKIRSISAFKGLTSPMSEISDNKWIPDFSSRYFTADFNFGLKIILDMCILFDIDAPNIKKVWDWYTNLCPNASDNCFCLYMTKDELMQLYA